LDSDCDLFLYYIINSLHVSTKKIFLGPCSSMCIYPWIIDASFLWAVYS